MKYLDSDGLLYFAQKIKTWLSGKVDKVDGKGLSTNDFTTTLKNKLDGISAGAEVNVQADWNVTDTTSDAYIKNKPTIPSGATLYSSTGQNTNGAMTQKATTDALNGKANSSHTHDDRYYTETEVDNKIATAISGVTQFDYEVVTTLPTTGVKGKIYLKAHSHGTGDGYDEYIWVGSAFEKIGNTDIDLSGYQTKITTSNKLAYSLISGTPDLSVYVQASSLTAITNAEIDTICS